MYVTQYMYGVHHIVKYYAEFTSTTVWSRSWTTTWTANAFQIRHRSSAQVRTDYGCLWQLSSQLVASACGPTVCSGYTFAATVAFWWAWRTVSSSNCRLFPMRWRPSIVFSKSDVVRWKVFGLLLLPLPLPLPHPLLRRRRRVSSCCQWRLTPPNTDEYCCRVAPGWLSDNFD